MITHTEQKNFLDVDDYSTYFIKYDALRSVEYDIAFSPTKLYYCDAGCQVCYIREELKKGKAVYANYVPDTITDKQTKEWFKIFDYFYKVLVTDDLSYLKKNHTHVYEWYKEHAGRLEYGLTDNALIKQMDILLNEVSFKSICDMSLSDQFIKKVNAKKNHNEVKGMINQLLDKYDIAKMKYLYILDETPDRDSHEILDLIKEKGIVNATQDDLRKDTNRLFTGSDKLNEQNNWFATYKGKPYFILGEQADLMGSDFYFNASETAKVDSIPFYSFKTGHFNADDMLVSMLKEKMRYYKQSAEELKDATDPWIVKMREYYINTTERFVINDDFNFIPKIMLNENTKFYWKLSKTGYTNTEYGLYRPGDKIKPIIEFRG